MQPKNYHDNISYVSNIQNVILQGQLLSHSSFISNLEMSFCSHPSCNEVIAKDFAHSTTAVVSWHVQNFVAMKYHTMEWQHNQFAIEFELRWKTSFVKLS